MGQQQPAERQLIERARSGEARAQQYLWRSHRRWVAAIVLAHRPRAIEVEDLMQDVAVKFVSRIETLRDVEAFRPWLRQIVINICRGAARSHRPTLQLAEDQRSDDGGPLQRRPGGPAATGASPDRLAARRDSADRLLNQVMTLPAEYREPLLLRAIQGLTHQQIGEILDLPVTTVETRLARARRMLREEIGEEILATESGARSEGRSGK